MTVHSPSSKALRGAALLASLSLLAACTSTETPQRYEAVASNRNMAHGSPCPDLQGTWRFDGTQPARQFFIADAPVGFAPTLLSIDALPDQTSYPMAAGVDTDQAKAAANQLLARDPAAYATWRERNVAQRAAREAQQSTSDQEREIAALGPLLRHETRISRMRCDAHWMKVADLQPARYGVIGGNGGGDHELELWLARDAAGALLVRFDRYDKQASWLLGRPIRLSRAQYFYKMEAVIDGAGMYVARDSILPPPKPPEPEFDPAVRERALMALYERVQRWLPAGMVIDKFEPKASGTEPPRHGAQVRLDIEGSAASNADISQFMRQLDSDEALSGLELISIRAEDRRMIWKMQVDWTEVPPQA